MHDALPICVARELIATPDTGCVNPTILGDRRGVRSFGPMPGWKARLPQQGVTHAVIPAKAGRSPTAKLATVSKRPRQKCDSGLRRDDDRDRKSTRLNSSH